MKYLLLSSTLLWAIINTFAQANINGVISDSETGEALYNATVYNLTKKTGVTTDFFGRFTLLAEEGSDSIRVSYVGYEESTFLAKETLNVKLSISLSQLGEVLVSVNREQEKRTEAAIAISSISSQAIAENKPTTIDQVLNQSPGVYMVDLGNEQHTMSIRKPIDYGASYLYLEDGIPIRASGVFNHNGLLEINMANTSKIEIIRGPASSMYGSEAIGGAVNFISKKATTSPTAGISIQGNNIGYKRTDFYASNTVAKKLGIRIGGYYANQKDGIIKHSDFNKLALSLSANYALSENTELVWSNTLVNYYSEMTGSLDSTDFFDKNYQSNQTFTNRQVDSYRTKLALNHYWNSNAKSTLTSYFRSNSVKQNPSYRVKDDYIPWLSIGDANLAHGEINDNSFNSYGIIAQHKQKFKFLNSSLIVGGSFDYSPNTYKANYINIYKNNEGVYKSFTKTDSLLVDYVADLTNVSGYTKLKVEPIKGLHVIGALRFDQFIYAFDNNLGANAYTSVLDGENLFSRMTPKIGATYDFKKNRGMYANYSQGFVPPQVGQLYRGNEIPTLKPVYYTNVEAGGWMSLIKNKARLEVSLFKMDGLNEIISVLQNDGSTLRQNAGKTTHQGVEYGLTYLVHKDLNIRMSGTNTLHEFVDYDESGVDLSGNKMGQSPAWVANAQVTYKPSFVKGLRMSLEWQHIDRYYMDQQNTKEYKGHNIFNIRLGYEWKSFEIWTNVINSTDELYATVSRSSKWGDSYSLGKPRSFNIGLAYKFKKK